MYTKQQDTHWCCCSVGFTVSHPMGTFNMMVPTFGGSPLSLIVPSLQASLQTSSATSLINGRKVSQVNNIVYPSQWSQCIWSLKSFKFLTENSHLLYRSWLFLSIVNYILLSSRLLYQMWFITMQMTETSVFAFFCHRFILSIFLLRIIQ